MSSIVKDRIDVRINKDQKELIKYASELRGFKSMSEFVVYCINNEANNIIKDHNLILKTEEDNRIFLKALLNPPTPNAHLKKAQLNYNKFIEVNEFNNRTSE